MAIRYLKTHAALEGHLGAEDAEGLVEWLRAQARPQVHLGKCESLHAALLQTLLAFRPRIKAAPADRWLCAALGLEPPAASASAASTSGASASSAASAASFSSPSPAGSSE